MAKTTLRNLTVAFVAAVAGAMLLGEIARAAEPIRLGMTVSSTGRFALAAQSGERGVQIWLDDVKRRGGSLQYT